MAGAIRNDPVVDYSFAALEVPIMALLANFIKRSNRTAAGALCKAFHPIWDYYIKYYLYKNGVYDNNPEFQENYQEMYLNCIELLPKVSLRGCNFNRIKRYYNKSIGGWIFNELFKKPKKEIEFITDEDYLMTRPDYENQYLVVDIAVDLQKIKVMIQREVLVFLEFCMMLMGMDVYKHKDFYIKKYSNAVYKQYAQDGSLLTGEQYFNRKFGGVFCE